MIIALRFRFSINDFYTFFYWTVAALTGLFFFYFLIVLLKAPVVEGVIRPSASATELSGARIFTGPLSLKENTRSPLAISLEQKLTLLAQSMRPDVKAEEKVYCIGVQGSDEKRVVREGEPIFASLTPHPNGGVESVAFVEEGEGMAMIPHVLDENSLLLQVGEMEVILKASTGSIQKQEGIPGIEELASAKWWGKDRLFEAYGGDDYHPLSQKEKVEIGSEMVFVGPGDFLSMQEGRWKALKNLVDATRGAPLAHVRSVSKEALLLEVWDKDGFPIFQGQLKPQSRESIRVNPDQLLIDARLRSAKQVSCQMEKKRMTLKEGDWVFKGKSGWIKLKTLSEIEAFLQHQQNGELFIVDQIDPNGQLKGHYFDEKRTQMQPLVLKISQQPQKTTTTASKRRGHLSKL